ncbi:NAD(P)H-dependent flavin oxidoreductase [Pelagibius sp.]|uniref:NAD(P)H-dependent flavin oxidoreductase n=1 Tax=Pelagibius sp. TaxID=1931238 RepID=UPI003BB005F2
MRLQTALARRLGIELPILQAPMAGGGDTPALVGAVCDADGFGSIGAAYLTPQQIAETSRKVRERTNRPFGINLFAPGEVPVLPTDPSVAIERVSPFFMELGLDQPSVPSSIASSFDEQFETALESGASVFSFTLGIVPQPVIEAAKSRGMFVVGTATTVEEAVELEAAGVDAIVAQGAEAGGHRATFTGDFDAGLIGVMSLVPQVVDAVSVPVIASGGIMDGRGLAAALVLGAQAVQLGTAFLATDEAGVPSAYKDAVLGAAATQTRITRAFSGRPARGLTNRFMVAIESAPEPDAVLPFPYQNALTRPLRAAAAKQARSDCLSLWAGQGVAMSQRGPAADLVRSIADDAREALAALE